MENQGLINKIKSTYIIKDIFNYIQDINFHLKLFIYSKYFQNKLEIRLIYREKYLDKIGFDINKYLHKKKGLKKDYINKKYDNFLNEKKINKKEFENIIYDLLS